MKTRTINYDQKPYKIIKTKGKCAWTGYENIIQELKSKIEEHKKTVFVIECYPGVYQKEILENFKKLICNLSNLGFYLEEINIIEGSTGSEVNEE